MKLLGEYQNLSQLNEQAAAAIKQVFESDAIQSILKNKELKLDLDDNAQ